MRKTARNLALAIATASVFAVAAAAQGPGSAPGGQGDRPMTGPGMTDHGPMGPGAMQPGGMMGQGMMMDPGTMSHGWGNHMMGPGMMGPGMMGPGMMGQGMMGWGRMQPLPEDLTVANVRHMMEHRVAWQRNPNLKVGKVEEKDKDTIVADVVTKDGSLVRRYEIDRHTGWMRPVG